MRLNHPNVVRCLGATTNPLQIVMDLMPNGEVMNYLKKYPNVSPVHFVSLLVFAGQECVV